MEIKLKTLTPLWTGGADGTVDRLHETGLIGSLRWWYEALVRGLGGYACDPTGDDPEARCKFDTEAYALAKKDGKTEGEAIEAGLHSVCPVCYVFGATGWARLFQLRATKVPTTPLHFRSTVAMNRGWFRRVFGGESQNIDLLQVPYGEIQLQFIPRRHNADYARSQFVLALRLAADYGGIGARLQHGFGQFAFPPELNDLSLTVGLAQLNEKIQQGIFRSKGPTIDTPFNLKNFVSLTFEIPKNALNVFLTENAHAGSIQKREEKRYIPCAFDLRYKGTGNLGMRQWLQNKGWKETINPKKLEELDLLLGPRSQWGKNKRKIDDNLRTASRVFFGMPYQKDGNDEWYVLRVWAFLPLDAKVRSRLPNSQALKALLEEYIQYAFRRQARNISAELGENILAQTVGGTK